jgi:hypothetical protein
MKRLIAAALLAVSLTGCGALTGADAIATTVAAASDVLTGPDTDYKNYLSHCRIEVQAQRDAIKADTEALKAALSDGNDKTQFGATLIMAFKAGQGGPKIGCTAARKKGAVELLLGESDLLRLGVDLYRENRAGARFNRQLEADKEMTRERLSHDREMADRQNDLLTTLSGDKLEQFKAQAEADSQARRDAAEPR